MAERTAHDEATKAAVMAALLTGQSVAYVYGLRAADSREYFYVGCTKDDPHERLREHLYQVATGTHSNKHFANKVRVIDAKNVVCDVLETTDILRRWQVEIQWINKLLADGVKLVNRIHNEFHYSTLGSGGQPTPEQWQRLLKYADGSPMIAKDPRLQRVYDLMHELLRAEIRASEAIAERLAEVCPNYVRFSME